MCRHYKNQPAGCSLGKHLYQLNNPEEKTIKYFMKKIYLYFGNVKALLSITVFDVISLILYNLSMQ